VEKYNGIHGFLGPTDPTGIAAKPEETWIGFVVSPTFMLGIWHRG